MTGIQGIPSGEAFGIPTVRQQREGSRLAGDDLVIVIPLYRRTAHVERVYASARLATPEARIMFVVSHGDHDVGRLFGDPIAAEKVGIPLPTFDARTDVLFIDGPGGGHGDYARKINEGYRYSAEPFIFTGADDIDFHPEWYDAARAFLDGYGRAVGVVGTVDLCNQRTMDGEHSTHSLVARWYADKGACVDQDHVIYHEGYPHDYVDDELVQTAMARGAYAHSYLSIVEHLHPNAAKAPDDETYRHGRANRRLGLSRYRRRRRLWGVT